MKEHASKDFPAGENKEKKSIGEKISKLLMVLCSVALVALIAVTAIALINVGKEKQPDTSGAAPEIITTEPTTQPTTLASADTVKVKGTVYATKKTNIYAAPTKEETVVASLEAGDSISFVSVAKDGWCTVVYDEKVCYVHRNGLSTKKPEVTTEATTTEAASSSTEAAQSSQETERKVVNLNKKKHWSVVVVDKNREMPEGYVPELEYVAESEYSMDARVAVYYDAMYKAAYADGVVLTPYSGYRSFETQDSNYNYLVDQYIYQGYSQQEAEELAATEILPAGCSEHNIGLAMDISGTEESFKDTEEYKWLCENAHTYGFIERYPEGKQDVTGVIPEPWHWRFVGPAYAEDMKAKGFITLEEYLDDYGMDY